MRNRSDALSIRSDWSELLLSPRRHTVTKPSFSNRHSHIHPKGDQINHIPGCQSRTVRHLWHQSDSPSWVAGNAARFVQASSREISEASLCIPIPTHDAIRGHPLYRSTHRMRSTAPSAAQSSPSRSRAPRLGSNSPSASHSLRTQYLSLGRRFSLRRRRMGRELQTRWSSRCAIRCIMLSSPLSRKRGSTSCARSRWLQASATVSRWRTPSTRRGVYLAADTVRRRLLPIGGSLSHCMTDK